MTEVIFEGADCVRVSGAAGIKDRSVHPRELTRSQQLRALKTLCDYTTYLEKQVDKAMEVLNTEWSGPR
jgi:hypothetical protein